MKKYKVIISEQANLDIKEAKGFYRRASSEVRNRLKNNILAQTRKLKDFPFANAVRYTNVRFATLQDYPFALHYIIDESASTVYIIACYHVASNPNKGPLRAAE